MVKQFLKIGVDEIEKQKFYFSRNPITIDDVDINKIIKSDASACDKNKKTGAKFFVRYKDDKKTLQLQIILPKTVFSFKESKYISFEIKKK